VSHVCFLLPLIDFKIPGELIARIFRPCAKTFTRNFHFGEQV